MPVPSAAIDPALVLPQWLLDADAATVSALVLPAGWGWSRWVALDGGVARAYAWRVAPHGEPADRPSAGGAPAGRPSAHPAWQALRALEARAGASAADPLPGFHYTVETDVAPADEAEFSAWYSREHLPGLAAVPGTVQAMRLERCAPLADGGPRFVAAYHLTDPATLERPEWLAVRHTDWSSRVRPLFVRPRRTMFRRL